MILSGVGDELVIAHPTEELPAEELAVVAGGPALYLLGLRAVPAADGGLASRWKRLAGALACIAVGLVLSSAPALVLAALLVGVLVAVIAAEHVAAARRSARGEPSPLERLDAPV